jgi:hypothetical protein
LFFSSSLYADDVEYKIKAGYLYNFTKFITWPEDQSASFNLCLLGHDPFGELIDPIEQRTAFFKPIKVLRIPDTQALRRNSKSIHCHILFINLDLQNLPPLLDVKNVLVVGDGDDFAINGGMIGFITDNSRIKLQINWQAFKQSELKVSAKLLEVADVINGDIHD